MAKVYYLCFFAAIGAISPFFNIYLQERGLSGAEIGLVGSIPPLISLAANPFWGTVADRWQIHQLVLAVCVLAAGLLSIPFVWLNGFWPILAVLLLMIFFRTPVMALLDASVMGMVARTGASYGRQRLFGSLGYLLLAYGLGQVMSADQLDLIFWMHGLLLIVGCTLLSFLLPMERHGDGHGEGQHGSMIDGLKLLAGQRPYVSFLLMNVLYGFGAACFINFLGLRLLSLGGTEAQVGLASALSATAEIPVMFLGARLLSRYGMPRLIFVGLLGLTAAYALAGVANTPLLVLIVMGSVGFAGGAFWMAVVGYANESAPPRLRATGQSLVGAAQGGLGWALGSITGGVLWDAAGGTVVMWVAAVSLFVGALVFWVGQKR